MKAPKQQLAPGFPGEDDDGLPPEYPQDPENDPEDDAKMPRKPRRRTKPTVKRCRLKKK